MWAVQHYSILLNCRHMIFCRVENALQAVLSSACSPVTPCDFSFCRIHDIQTGVNSGNGDEFCLLCGSVNVFSCSSIFFEAIQWKPAVRSPR